MLHWSPTRTVDRCVMASTVVMAFRSVILTGLFFFSSRRRHTRSVSAFLLNRSSDLRISGMALLILALLQRIFLMSSLMLLLVWLIFFMVLIKLLPILGTISGKTVKLMVLALICLGNNRQD